MAQDLSGRIAVVTGASRGIGAAVARALGAAGAHVVAIARTSGALEELDDQIRAGGGTATLVPLDLRDFAALDRLGASLAERYGKLDVLVGNAGILGPLSPLPHVEPKPWGDVLDVNLTANFRLLRSLDPLLQRSDAGRAVFVTSGAAGKAHAYWGPYAISKAALEVMVRTYAAETERTAVRANLFNPGPLRTRMRAQAMPGEDPDTLEPPDTAAAHLLDLCRPACTRTGQLYDYPSRGWLRFNPPTPAR